MRSGFLLVAVLASVAGCTTDDEPAPSPTIRAIEPQAICPTAENAPVVVDVFGAGFVVNDDHTAESMVEFWRGGFADNRKRPLLESDTTGTHLAVKFENGESAPASNEPPMVFEVHVVNPDDQTAVAAGDFRIYTRFGFNAISPAMASATSPVTINLAGGGFYGPMKVILETQLSTFATDVQVTSPTTATATFDLAGTDPGTYAVTMRNAGGCSYTKVSAFTVMP